MNPYEQYEAVKLIDQGQSHVSDLLVVEEMLSISVNGSPYTITMRTPGDEEAHTRGILFTENVYTGQNIHPEFMIIQTNEKAIITQVNVRIDVDKLQSGITQQRNLLSVSSCGMCGKYEMDLSLHGTILCDRKIKPELVEMMFLLMKQEQKLFAQTGGCHAAAIFNLDGQLLDCKEDIGRHNAVDKAIGSLLLKGALTEAGILLVSGRVSYEIVSKAHKAGVPFLCSVSAPSSMAVDYCQQSGITLLAFCRDKSFTAYAHAERLEIA